MMERYAEVKRKVSSLATSGATALAVLALIPPVSIKHGMVSTECRQPDKQLHYKEVLIKQAFSTEQTLLHTCALQLDK